MIKLCQCGEKIEVIPRLEKRTKYCSKKCFYKFRVRPKGLKYVLHKINPTSFKKGFRPWNKGKRYKTGPQPEKHGKHYSPRTEFKKGFKPLNNGKEFKQIREEKHSNWKGGYTVYRKIARRNGLKPICEKCGKRGMWGNKIVVHHKDKNRNNNKLTNLSILCSMCHVHLHQNWKFKKNAILRK